LSLTTKQADGSTALSSTTPTRIAFRSRTVTSGGYSVLSLNASETLTVPSTATLGYLSATGAKQIFVYLCYDGTTVALGVSSFFFNESELVTTLALDTSSDSLGVLYTASAMTSCAIRFVGVVEYSGAAGTYTTPSLVAVSQAGFHYAKRVWEKTYDFEAQSSSTSSWGGTAAYATWTFSTENYDPDSVFDGGTGEFTAPYSGVYTFGVIGTSASQDLETAGDRAIAIFFINGSAARVFWFEEVDDPNSARQWAAHGTIQVYLDQGDIVTARGNQLDDSATNRNGSELYNWFWGRMVRRA
jgi:hypothetical protein